MREKNLTSDFDLNLKKKRKWKVYLEKLKKWIKTFEMLSKIDFQNSIEYQFSFLSYFDLSER